MERLLLSPLALSPNLQLKNRIIMAPMTRRKADADHVPSEIMVDYYASRASAGLIITEGTLISKDAIGYGNVPGIYSNKQIESWRKVTSAVHRRGGLIFVQLWHCGRISHPIFHEGKLPISASSMILNMPLGHSGYQCSPSRAATLVEIASLIEDYAGAAKNAIDAGFDGVEIHGANGYLIDQFLHYGSNQRQDEYGVTPENMARFCLEILTACGLRIGFDKIGLRLSPGGHMNEITTEERDQAIYRHLLKETEKLNIAYVHTGIFDDTMVFPALQGLTATAFLRRYFQKTLVASGGYHPDKAENAIKAGEFNLIALGRPFIAGTDVVENIRNYKALKEYRAEMLQEL